MLRAGAVTVGGRRATREREAEAVAHQPAHLATARGAKRAPAGGALGARAAASAAAVAERRFAIRRLAPPLLRLLAPHALVPEHLCGCGARRVAAPQAERLNHGLPRALARLHGARRLDALPGPALAGPARSGAAGTGRLSLATCAASLSGLAASAGAARLAGAAAQLPPLLPRQRMAQHREQRVDWAAEGRRSVLEACQRLHRGRGAKARLVCGRRERQRVHRRQPPTAPHHAMPPVGAGVGRRRE
mmetsp:Transcript_19499/g.63759  ORF Transcript_19499/g.63759 Transcript_19499/m.63759 type:complete len:247 (-) Transcript_19499:320-1060(-)